MKLIPQTRDCWKSTIFRGLVYANVLFIAFFFWIDTHRPVPAVELQYICRNLNLSAGLVVLLAFSLLFRGNIRYRLIGVGIGLISIYLSIWPTVIPR
jgi:hypothetical protein